jgi:hypothetical protein
MARDAIRGSTLPGLRSVAATAVAVAAVLAAAVWLLRPAAGPQGGAREAKPAPAAAPGDANSIAVLPFVNMSPDPDQEYFSDGLSEELLDVLSKIPELRVISRTSSFQFKGKSEDIRTIARKLNVARCWRAACASPAADPDHRAAGERGRRPHLYLRADRELTTFAVQGDTLAWWPTSKVTLLGLTAARDRARGNAEAYNPTRGTMPPGTPKPEKASLYEQALGRLRLCRPGLAGEVHHPADRGA